MRPDEKAKVIPFPRSAEHQRPMHSHSGESRFPKPTRPLHLLHRWLFDHSFNKGYAQNFDNLIAWLIILSIVTIVAEHNALLYSPHAGAFHIFELLTVGIFTIEYLLRLATAPLQPELRGKSFARVRYFFSFYALIDLVAIVPFYFASVVSVDLEMLRVLRALRLMRLLKLSRYMVPAWQEFHALNHGRSFRSKLYALLEPTGHSGRLHVYFDNFIIFWVLLSITSVILESIDSVRKTLGHEFAIIDLISFSIFTLEYAARLYAAPENPRYSKHPLPRWLHVRSGKAIIDLLTILPFLLERLLPVPLDLRFLRVFRLARLLKLTRYTTATRTLYTVVKREWQVIFASVFVMLLMVVFTASIGYLFEHEAQPHKFENIPQSIYWAVVTLASVGYGDISPITPMGRALTVVLALLGIGIFAIPAGLLASAFTDQLRIDREAFKHRLLQAYKGGDINPKARALLAAESERLHLSSEDIQRLTREAHEEFEARKRQEKAAVHAVVIDPARHPDLIARQLRLLVSQVHLLTHACDREALLSELSHQDEDEARVRRVIAALRDEAAKPPASDAGADRPGWHPVS